VKVFPGILFKWARRIRTRFVVLHGDFDPAMLANGGFVLRNLTALRQIGIERFFTGEPVLRTVVQFKARPARTAISTAALLMTGRLPGAPVHGARLAVGRASEGRAAAAEHLGFRSQLGMDFDADNDFVHHRLSVITLRLPFLLHRLATGERLAQDRFPRLNEFFTFIHTASSDRCCFARCLAYSVLCFAGIARNCSRVLRPTAAQAKRGNRT
jgi:hypothetical protein